MIEIQDDEIIPKLQPTPEIQRQSQPVVGEVEVQDQPNQNVPNQIQVEGEIHRGKIFKVYKIKSNSLI